MRSVVVPVSQSFIISKAFRITKKKNDEKYKMTTVQ